MTLAGGAANNLSDKGRRRDDAQEKRGTAHTSGPVVSQTTEDRRCAGYAAAGSPAAASSATSLPPLPPTADSTNQQAQSPKRPSPSSLGFRNLQEVDYRDAAARCIHHKTQAPRADGLQGGSVLWR